jgi:DNA polymerase-3 subunit delta'
LVRGDISALAGWAPAQVVEALQKLCHDLLAVHTGAAPRFFDRSDLPGAGSFTALTAWWRSLAATARTVEHPFNPGLMLEDLVAQARTALHSKSEP